MLSLQFDCHTVIMVLPTVEKVKLGSQGFEVSKQGLGCMGEFGVNHLLLVSYTFTTVQSCFCSLTPPEVKVSWL